MEYCILSGQDLVVYEGTNIIMLFESKLDAKQHVVCEINEHIIFYSGFIKYECGDLLENFFPKLRL
jgi:hypothetical protein